MKTLADFKRALEVGSRWHAFYHLSGYDMGIRTVIKNTSYEVSFLRDGGKEPSHLTWPKGSEISFNLNGSVNVHSEVDNTILLTYTKAN